MPKSGKNQAKVRICCGTCLAMSTVATDLFDYFNFYF